MNQEGCSWQAENCGSLRLSLYHLARCRYQTGDMYDQPSFRYSGQACELNPHARIYSGVPDNPLQRDVRLPGPQRERNFRSNRKWIRVEDENALQT